MEPAELFPTATFAVAAEAEAAGTRTRS